MLLREKLWYRKSSRAIKNRVLNLVVGSVAVLSMINITPAVANNYPERPVNIIMPWADGFPANSTRLYADKLSQRLGQPFVVQNRPGGGGEVAAKSVIPANPDGHTLLVTGSSITIRGVTNEDNADGERDLQPVAQITTSPYVLVSSAGKFDSFGGLLEAASEKPGSIDFASAGVGTGMHYLGELINVEANVDMLHIPYASGAQQLLAVVADEVDFAIISLVTALPQIKAGKLDALAVSTSERSQSLPETPTLNELGLENIPSIGAWIAIFAPKEVDESVLVALSKEIEAIAKDPEVVELVNSWGAEIPDTSVGFLEGVISTEKESWHKLITEQDLPIAD